eukprot:145629_1
MAQPAKKFACTTLIDRLLSSSWKLDRIFVSLKDGSTIGTASGMVQFSQFNDPNSNGYYLTYYEHGNMIYSASKSSSFPFKKHYLINVLSANNEQDKDKDKNSDNIIMKWYFDIINEPHSNIKYKPKECNINTLFVDKNFFIGFEFNENDYIQHKEISNVNPHLCDQDLYEGNLQFLNDNSFYLQYHVNGPSKMYNIQTTFTLTEQVQHEQKENTT